MSKVCILFLIIIPLLQLFSATCLPYYRLMRLQRKTLKAQYQYRYTGISLFLVLSFFLFLLIASILAINLFL